MPSNFMSSIRFMPSTLFLLAASCSILSAGPVTSVATSYETPLPLSLENAEINSRDLNQALRGDAVPPCEITIITTESGAVWKPRGDGTWLAPKDVRPNQDVITLTLVSKAASSFLRLDFLTDSSLVAGGPGQASNGNSVIGEIEIEVAGKPVKAEAYSSVSQSNQGRVMETAFDGIKQHGDQGWEAEASGFELGMGMPARIVVHLASRVQAGAAITVRLVAKSRWSGHVPGCVSAASIGGEKALLADSMLNALRSDLKEWTDRVQTQCLTRLSAGGAGMDFNSPIFRADMASAELLRVCTPEGVFKVASSRHGASFLRRFFSDTAWLESFLLGGQEGTTRCNYAQALENLRLLNSQLPSNTFDDPVSKKLATAMALQGGTMNRYRFVERFKLIEDSRKKGLLDPGFESLDVRAMRHAINLRGRAVDYRSWLEEAQFTPDGYRHACWKLRYAHASVYGYSVHFWGYHEPMRHAYTAPQRYRRHGGVCGAMSEFGSLLAVTHGVPSFTVPQPGHCAYVVRRGENWDLGNDAYGLAGSDWRVYEGIGGVSANALLEKTENAKEYPVAQRMLWAARMQKAANQIDSAWKSTYESALKAQPLNYAAWLEYVKALEEDGTITPTTWIAMGQRAAEIFKEHQGMGWALASRCLQNGKAQLPNPADRIAKLLEINKILSQKAVPTMYGYGRFNHYFNWQADFIGDDAQSVAFFGTLLILHHSDKEELNWVFSSVLSWGNSRFEKRPALRASYIKAIGDFFASKGENKDTAQAAIMISGGIRKASDDGDMNTYNAWRILAKKLLPPLKPEDVFMNAQQVAARPKVDPFPGTLLSASGMLQASSVSYGKPLSYGQVLDGGKLGYFDTAAEQNPWAQVMLQGKCEISGIVLVNRYEYVTEKSWDVPLKVSISDDGVTWIQVALFETPQDMYRVDLQGKGLQAKWVRIERQSVPDASKPNINRFHMRSFLVYGRKLY